MGSVSSSIRQYVVALALFGIPAGAAALSTAKAQTTGSVEPRQLLHSIIAGWRDGSDVTTLLSAQMAAVVQQQTQGTGVYKEIQTLGTVDKVDVVSQQQLPKGTLYLMRAQHQNGYADWLIGIGTASGRADYITFAVGTNPATQPFAAPVCYFVGPYMC